MVVHIVYSKLKFRLFLTGYFLFSLSIGLLSNTKINSSNYFEPLSLFVLYILWGTWIAWGVNNRGHSFKGTFIIFNLRNSTKVVLTTFAIIITYLAINNIVSDGMHFNKSKVVDGFTSIDILTLVVAIVIAPIVEEYYFRRIVLSNWSFRWGIRWGIILSSIVFGVFHSDLLGKVVFGILLAILYLNTKSIRVTILCHCLNNTFFLTFPLVFGYPPEDSFNSMVSKSFSIFILILIFYIIYVFMKLIKSADNK